MRELLDRFDVLRGMRAIGVALVVLVLTVGVALAAAPSSHPGNVGSHGQGHGPQASVGADESEAPEGSESPDGSETDENRAGDGAHGALVSAAARMDTPAGFRNHGAFVSCIAHMKNVTLDTIDWSSVTPASCTAAAPGNSDH